MTHQFKPGDPVLVIGGPRVGEVTTILRGPRVYLGRRDTLELVAGDVVYSLVLRSLNPLCDRAAARPEWLLPLLDDSRRAEYLQDLNLDAPSEGAGRD